MTLRHKLTKRNRDNTERHVFNLRSVSLRDYDVDPSCQEKNNHFRCHLNSLLYLGAQSAIKIYMDLGV